MLISFDFRNFNKGSPFSCAPWATRSDGHSVSFLPALLSTSLISLFSLMSLICGCAQSSSSDSASSSTQSTFSSTTYYSPINFGNLKNGDYIGRSQINPFIVSGSCSSQGAQLQISVTNGKTTLTQNATCSKKSDPNWSLQFDISSFSDGPFGVGGGQFDPNGILSTVAPIALIKLTFPMLPALSPMWITGSPTLSLNPTAGWIPSLAPTLAYQRVQFYAGDACNRAVSSPPNPAQPSPQPSPTPSASPFPSPTPAPSASAPTVLDAPVTVGLATSVAFQGTPGTWTFKVMSFDKAGNSAETNCSAPLTILVDPAIAQPNIAPSPNALFPIENATPPLPQGQTATLATFSSPRGATISLGCTYQTLGLLATDPNYAAPETPCSQLDTLVQTGTSSAWVKKKWAAPAPATSGAFVWTPTLTQRGTFQFNLTATDGLWTAVPKTAIATVRENENRSLLLTWLDGLFASQAPGLASSIGASPKLPSSTPDPWLPLTSSGPLPNFQFGSSAPWSGTGSNSISSVDPYRLNFDATQSDRFDLGDSGSALGNSGTSAQWAIQTWIKPLSPFSAGKTVLSNAAGSNPANGMTLRQSASGNGSLELLVGRKYYTTPSLILSDRPIGYWRMNDANSTATDLSATGANGSYQGSTSLGESGALTGSGEMDSAVLFDGPGSGFMSAPLSGTSLSQLSVEFWFKPRTLPGGSIGIFQWANALSSATPFILIKQSGATLAVYVESGDAINPSVTLSTNTWTHLALTLNSSNVWTLYVNGVSSGSFASTPPHANQASASTVTFANGYTNYFDGWIDEAAIYNYALSASQIQNHVQTALNGKQVLSPLNSTLADNPTGYWRLNDKSPAQAIDQSGGGNHLSLGSSVPGKISLYQPGPISGDGSSRSIDWTQAFGQYANAALPTAMLNQTDNFAMEAWVYPNSASQLAGIVTNGVTASLNSGYGFLMHSGSGSVGSRVTAYVPGVAWDATNSNFNISVNQWTHLVLTRSNGNWKFYANGAIQGTGTTTPNAPAASFVVGDVSLNNTCCTFQGRIAEVATYSYPLSAKQVQDHYNSGLGAKPWYCQSQSLLTSSAWSLAQGSWDNSELSLFVNGQRECQLSPGTSYNPGTVPLTVGASPSTPASSFWSGALGSLKLFGTRSGSSSGGATLAAQGVTPESFDLDFFNGSNRYRGLALEATATSGLVLSLDAANAKQGLSPFSNGCALSDLSWFDLSPSGMSGLGLASLVGFSNCGAGNGWIGSGTPASPYALNFNGTSQVASVPLDLSGTSTVSIELWATWSAYSNTDGMLAEFTPNINSSTGGFFINPNPSGTCSQTSIQIASNGNIGYNVGCFSRPTAGTPHHLVTLFDRSKNGSAVISFYVDGNKIAPLSYPLINSNTNNFASSTLYLMSRGGSTLFNAGSLSVVRVYNRALTLSEIRQNCLAQEGRFTATSQGICAAP